MKWDIMDARNMSSYSDEFFELIIDKGTMDAIFTGKEAAKDIAETLNEC